MLGCFPWIIVRIQFTPVKKSFEYASVIFLDDTWRNFLAATIKFVIFMAQRPSANRAVFRVKEKLPRTLSDSAKCWRLLGNESMVTLTIDSSLRTKGMLVLLSEIYLSSTVRCVSSCNYSLRSRRFLPRFSLNLSWLQRVRDTRKWRAVTTIITFLRRDLHLKNVICSSWSSAVTLKFVAFTAKKTWRTVTNVCVFLVDAIIFLWFVYILPLEMTLPLLESDW